MAEISCDTCEDYTIIEPTMRDATRIAKKDGWILAPASEGGDMCPMCRKAIEDVTEDERALRVLG